MILPAALKREDILESRHSEQQTLSLLFQCPEDSDVHLSDGESCIMDRQRNLLGIETRAGLREDYRKPPIEKNLSFTNTIQVL